LELILLQFVYLAVSMPNVVDEVYMPDPLKLGGPDTTFVTGR
jgi:hypothetical protein